MCVDVLFEYKAVDLAVPPPLVDDDDDIVG